MFALDVQLAASNLHYGLAAVTVWRLADGITGENSYLGGAYRRFWKDFECEPRNDIEVKAVGILKTLWVATRIMFSEQLLESLATRTHGGRPASPCLGETVRLLAPLVLGTAVIPEVVTGSALRDGSVYSLSPPPKPISL